MKTGRGIANRFSMSRDLYSYLLASSPDHLFIFCFERAWYVKMHHVMSLCITVDVSMEMPPFTMTSFQSACKYSSSETDGKIAS